MADHACISALLVWDPCIWTLSSTSSSALRFQEVLV